jgi:hypothetical protein
VEQLLKSLNNAEDADALVLVQVIQVPHGDDPLTGDGLVVRLDARGHLSHAKIDG